MDSVEILDAAEILKKYLAKDVFIYLQDGKLNYRAYEAPLTAEMKSEITQNKAMLIKYLQEVQSLENQEQPLVKNITKQLRPDHIPLSFAQQRLWFIDQLEGGSIQYNMPGRFLLEGEFNENAFIKALNHLIERHEVLRTHFKAESNQVSQVIARNFDLPYRSFDLTEYSEIDRSNEVKKHIEIELEKPFNLSKDLMLRVVLLKLTKNQNLVLYTTHHIASDGWSIKILQNEIGNLYKKYCSNKESDLAPLKLQYADYTLWQRGWLRGEVRDKAMSYWKKQLRNLPLVHSLPLDRPRPAKQTFKGSSQYVQFDNMLVQKIHEFNNQHNTTLFMFMQTVLSILISRFSGEKDVVIGSVIAGRSHKDVEDLIGFFVNDIVLRMKMKGSFSFINQLKEHKQTILDAYRFQYIPFEMLVEELNPERSLSHSPLFQIKLDVQNNEKGSFIFSEVDQPNTLKKEAIKKRKKAAEHSVKHDLYLSVIENSEGLSIAWRYSTDLFDDKTIENLISSFEQLTRNILKSPQTEVRLLRTLDLAAQESIIELGEGERKIIHPSTCIHELFESQVEQNPDNVALVYQNKKLSYLQLNQASNQLANYLIAKGVMHDTLIGICVERSIDMVVGILAVLKAGGAYVPLDPTTPQTRLEVILKDSGCQWVLSESEILSSLSFGNRRVLPIEQEYRQQLLAEYSVENPALNDLNLLNSHLAYVIYTSGSTGLPKGVQITHESAVNYLRYSAEKYFQTVEGAVVSSSLAFDATVTSLLTPLICGKRVELIQQGSEELLDLQNAIFSSQQNLLFKLTPAHLDQIAHSVDQKSSNEHFHQLIIGGEQLSKLQVEKWQVKFLPNATFVNEYGPTETVVGCSTFFIPPVRDSLESFRSVPIGDAICNTELYVVDSELNLSPRGVIGELLIGGKGIARAYLNQARLTAEKFVPDPFSRELGKRLYRTGDLVRWVARYQDDRPHLEFIGRLDNQVKLRGFRIEIDDVVCSIRQLANIKDCAVQIHEFNEGDKRLVAYLVLENKIGDDQENEIELIQFRENVISELKESIAESLPNYMIPQIFLLLDSMPINSNGKIDLSALPRPDEQYIKSVDYLAPRNATERRLCRLWQDVLKLKKVGVKDNFFNLGGHSLLATQLINLVRQEFNLEIALSTLFDSPTIAGLSKRLDLDEREFVLPAVKVAKRSNSLPLSYAQQRLWFIEQLQGSGVQYHMPGRFSINEKIDLKSFKKSLKILIQRHEVLRTRYIAKQGSPHQVIDNDFEIPLQVTDLANLSSQEKELRLTEILKSEFTRVFDLSNDLLIRVRLIKLSDDENLVCYTMHHIASDGWSVSIFRNELMDLYTAFSNGKSNPLPNLEIQYADYADWQSNWLQGEVLEQELDYWKHQLAGIPTIHQVPTDRPRPIEQTFAGRTVHQIVDKVTTARIYQLCEKNEVTLFMFLQTAFAVFLRFHSNQKDIVMASPIAGRTHSDIEALIGFFVNTLVLRTDLSVQQSFKQLLGQNKKMILEAFAHQHLPFELLVDELNPERALSHNPLAQILFALQNNHRKEDFSLVSGSSRRNRHKTSSERLSVKFDIELIALELNQELVLDWGFNQSLFDEETILKMVDGFDSLLQKIIESLSGDDSGQYLDFMGVSNVSEKQKLIFETKQNSQDPSEARQIQELFELQAKNQPKAIVITYEKEQYSFSEVNQQANQLAHYLRSEGVVEGDTVSLCLDYSIELIVSMLAVLKLGAKYVPINPRLKKLRIEFLLDDCGSIKTLSKLAYSKHISDERSAIFLDSDSVISKVSSCNSTDLFVGAEYKDGERVAAILYTFEVDGIPSAIEISHNNIQYLVNKEYYQSTEHVKCAISRSVDFETITTEIWPILLNGNALTILPGAKEKGRLMALESVLDGVELISLTSGSLEEIVEQNLLTSSCIKTIIITDSSVSQNSFENILKYFPNVTVVNSYGSTISLTSTVRRVVTNISQVANGKYNRITFSNADRYLLNRELMAARSGAAGEIFSFGAGVPSEFSHRRKKFGKSPFTSICSKEKSFCVFNSGLTARELSNGEFELIESQVTSGLSRKVQKDISTVSKLIKQNSSVEKVYMHKHSFDYGDNLYAYVIENKTVVENNNEESDTVISLKQALREYSYVLPVPDEFIILESLPLTKVGLIDVKLLPLSNKDSNKKYIPPSNVFEEKLQEIWAKLLQFKAHELSVTDNFFNLGGDSILSIQLVSRAAQVGLHFSVKDLFSAQTIRELALKIKSGPKNNVPQVEVLGNTELLPIQKRFFQDDVDMAHFNQSFLLSVPKGFTQEMLFEIVEKLLKQHDALRLRFYQDVNNDSGAVWKGEYQEYSRTLLQSAVVVKDYLNKTEEELDEYATAQQKSLNLEKGILFKAVLLRKEMGSKQQDRLLLIVHHLVVDGVSWRIILEDIEAIFNQIIQGLELTLPRKTTSFQQWGSYLRELVEHKRLDIEREYWLKTGRIKTLDLASLNATKMAEENPSSERKYASFSLNKKQTNQLLSESNFAYRTQINELLLVGLLKAVHEVSGELAVRVDMESHGREPLDDSIDLSRTVGWFTSIYPLTLCLELDQSIGEVINAVKQQYRAVPNNGIGYGVLKAFSTNSDFQSLPETELAFNYLGQFKQVVNSDNHFRRSNGSSGESMSSARKAFHPLVMTGTIRNDCLNFSLSFEPSKYEFSVMQQLMDSFSSSLVEVIDHCLETERGDYVTSDFKLAKMTDEELLSWNANGESLEDIYPATGMQQGLLFHSLLETGSYVTQTVFEIRNLDISRYQAAWQQVVNRHAILRTAFVGIDTGNAHQLVKSKVSIPWSFEDLSELATTDRGTAINRIRLNDKLSGLEPGCAPLMKMTVVNLGNGIHQIIWSHHHALLDGWCLPLVLQEVTECYRALGQGTEPRLEQRLPYRDYATWLASQDVQEALNFWRQQLHEVDGKTPLPLVDARSLEKTEDAVTQKSVSFDQSETEELKALAKSSHTTLNVIVEAAWGLLLSRYCNDPKVVFGAVSSGRPAELAGVEQMIGLFINTLPVVMQVDSNDKLEGWLQNLHQRLVERESFNYFPLFEINKLSSINQNLFDSLVVFENYPIDEGAINRDATQKTAGKSLDDNLSVESNLNVQKVKSFDSSTFGIALVAHISNRLSVKLVAKQHLLSEQQVVQIAGNLRVLLLNMARSRNQYVKDISILSKKEKHELVFDLNNNKTDYSKSKDVSSVFLQNVKNTPDKIALVFEHQQISYSGLEHSANSLACYLKEQDVKQSNVVAICLPRSVDIVVAMIACLKLEAIYLPIDPEYPKSRIDYMLKDSKHKVLIDTALVADFKRSENIFTNSITPPKTRLNSAYSIIYTSGSTGQPKGVLLHQAGLLNHINNVKSHYDFEAKSKFLQFFNVAFDAAAEEIFSALYFGGTLVMRGNELSIEDIFRLIEQYKITHADFSTAFFQKLFDTDTHKNLNHKLVACGIGGEKVDKAFIVKNIEKLKKFTMKLFNVYGPTETTLTATIFDILSDNKLKIRDSLPIGKAYPNRQLYIVDRDNNLVPKGASGELLVGGVGVANGYLNNEELTKSKFIKSPFDTNEKFLLYKTGDLVRYLKDGNLAFLGRMDDQIKIRGFRVELGEIEQQLLSIDTVTSCVVIATEDEQGNKRLVAYFTQKGYLTSEQNEQESNRFSQQLKSELKKELPLHMVPSKFIRIDSLPLTRNGKVDKKALPKPNDFLNSDDYQRAESTNEKILLEIWSSLLELEAEKLSVNANFFEVGGDSILSLQVVSRAAQVGLHFSVKDMFDSPTIKELALFSSANNQKSDRQENVIGDMPLLPIHRQFLADESELHHFNQSFLLSTPISFDREVLFSMIEKLYLTHDALRLRFYKRVNEWNAEHMKYSDAMVKNTIVVATPEQASQQDIFFNELQKSLKPESGQLFKIGYVPKCEKLESEGKILLIIHHLVVDGVSWRTIFADLEMMFEQWLKGIPLQLPPKTSSYQQWGKRLEEFSSSEVLAEQKDYWINNNKIEVKPISQATPNKLVSFDGGRRYDRASFSLKEKSTEQLLTRCNQVYRTHINELLLAGLLLGVNRWSRQKSIRIDIEGHGREGVDEQIDLSRTLGWFTTVYPLTLSMIEDASLEEIICAVKEQYRSVPDKGIGFGVLKDLSRDKDFQNIEPSELLFNYLGQFGQTVQNTNSSHFNRIAGNTGQNVSSARDSFRGLSLSGGVSDYKLSFSLLFDRRLYSSEAMQSLMDSMASAMQELIEHCLETKVGLYTPSDFPLANIEQEDLTSWGGKGKGIEDIYPATGMQQGLLFHSLLEQGSYNTQTIFDIDDLDIELYQKAWQELVNRNSIFRTSFVGIDSGNAHQLVKSKVSLPFSVENLKTLSTSEQNARVEEIRRADKLVSFEPSEAPLMRMTALRLEDKKYKIIWSSHHALLDAWSTPLVMKEVTECYRALKTDEEPKLEARLPYRNYVAWLADQNLTEAREYWSKQLVGIESATNLPLVESDISLSEPNEVYLYRLSLTDSQSIRLSKLAKTCKVTVNVIVQAVWGLLLSRYSGTNKIAFGSTSSGRPAQLSGVEKMIGLFINTLPVVIDIEQEMTIENWLQKLHQLLAERETYNYLSLFEIQQLTSMKQALFDSLILFENVAVNQSKTDESNESALKVKKVKSFEGTNFGITLMATMSGNLFVELEVKKSLMPESSVKQIGEHLKQLLVGVSKSKDTLVREIEMLTYQERKYLQTGFNQTKIKYPNIGLVHQLIEEQTRLTPDTVALIFEQQQISYQELNKRANRLANYLISTGCGPETKVAICIDRSIDMMIGLLGILKSGACYIPLDPGYPDERLRYIIEDSGVSRLITSNSTLKKIDLKRIYNKKNSSSDCVQPLDCVIVGEEKYSENHNLDLQNPVCVSSPSNLAYIIYTSGSTGKPKGVRVTNDNLVNFLSSMKSSLNFNRNDRLLAVTTLSFDISGLELYLPLICGTSVDVAESGRIIDGEKLAKRIQEQEISVLQATPVTWKILLDSGWEGKLDLKALVGGEAFPKELSEKLMPKVSRLWNMYGPTETTIWSTMYELTKSKVATYIGSPISNTDVYVLDKDHQLCPVGVPGELYVGGSGVAQGYHNKAGLSAERFVPHLYCKEPGERLYRTGDIVRHMPEGGLDYIGREDFQVKVRGVRIELGEIESSLLRNDYVKDVAVIAHRDESGDQKLVAHVVADHTKQEEQKDLDMSLLFFAADEAETQENKYQLYVDSSKRADELGFTAIWTPERHFHEVAGLYPNPSILSSALAMVTKDIQLRAGSVVLPLHNPLRVAEEWSVVDNLSNGRVGVGFVSGWVPADFALSPNNYHDKREIMFDGINKVQELWRGNKISVKNGLDQDIELAVYPRPVQQELPVWLTCAGDPRMFQEAGQLGYNILTALLGQTVEEAAEKIALYRQALIANGHDPATKTVTMMLHTYLHSDQETAIEKSRGPFCEYMKSHIGLIGSVMDDLTVDDIDIENQEQLSDLANMAFERYLQGASLIGSPESCQPMISKMKEIGVDEVACLIDFGVPTSDILEGLESINELQTQQSNTFVPKAGALKLKEQLQRELPAQLVPNMFVFLEELPLTNNGKIDRNALQAPNILDSQNDYVPPTSKTEIVLVDIWSDVLQMPDTAIGISNSFFDIGGHSLLAIKLVAKINESLDTTVLLSDVFRLHDIARLGSYIDELKSGLRDDQHDIQRLGSSQDIHTGEDLEEFDL